MLRPIVIEEAGKVPVAQMDKRGDKPKLGWVSIDKLCIDDRYQRTLTDKSWRKIRSIAARFDWDLFTAVDIAPAGDGRYAVIDGQHRTHAALLAGEDKVPCRVILGDLRQQARAFAAINGDAMPVAIWTIYKAALAAGEPWAVASSELCEAAGCRLMTYNRPSHERKSGEVYAIGLVRELAEDADEVRCASFVLALKGLLDSVNGAQSIAWTNIPLKALSQAVHAAGFARQGLSSKALAYRIDTEPGLLDLHEEAQAQARAARREGKPTESACDLLVYRLLDKWVVSP